jgi:DNA repair protein RecN (Recombination protein N)
MIFDEIDVGVGGRTAQVIADKLHALGAEAQVLCITHLPQIAARGDRHFSIEKDVRGEKTIVSVTALDAPQRVEELARMLGGARRTETVVQHAREMLGVNG